MRAAELTTGRQFGLVLDDGEDFLPSLAQFCAEREIRQAYLDLVVGWANPGVAESWKGSPA